MIVQVIQYMRPNGQKVFHDLEISDACLEKYTQILAVGGRLTAEQLMTGQVSQAIELKDFDFDIIITKGYDLNENKQKLEEMILRFDKEACLKQIKENEVIE